MVFDTLTRQCLLGCWSSAGDLSFEPFARAGRDDAQVIARASSIQPTRLFTHSRAVSGRTLLSSSCTALRKPLHRHGTVPSHLHRLRSS
jgi:hypothetical protein